MSTLASIDLDHPYRGLWTAIATMHRKEEAIAPVLCRWFGMTVTNAPNVNTDKFGTFTGEILRVGSMVDAARAKAMLAIEHTGAPLGLGSEGSFGPDPHFPFLASGLEVLLLRDARTEQEIVISRRSNTNFNQITLDRGQEFEKFLHQVGFPDHGVIVQSEHFAEGLIFKGLRSFAEVERSLSRVFSTSRKAVVTTDMRAHLNPTRMKAIARAAKYLALRIARLCPNCSSPGFGPTDAIRGLPCRVCGLPTRLVQAEVHSCSACRFKTLRHERSNAMRADPQFCIYCNP